MATNFHGFDKSGNYREGSRWSATEGTEASSELSDLPEPKSSDWPTRTERRALSFNDDEGNRFKVNMEWTNGRLSITGEMRENGQRYRGGDFGAGGQIHDLVRNAGYGRLADLWERHHLNDMRAGCEHQRAAGWKPATYGSPEYGTDADPVGKPCPECGYRYGSAWLREDVPDEALESLFHGRLVDFRTPAVVTNGTFPTAAFAGSDSERQSVGDPGHCERCAEVGHVVAHPDLGCGDVGCTANHGEDA